MTAPRSVARLPPRRQRRLGLVVLLVALFALLPLLSNVVRLAAVRLWFESLGYERVFTTRLVAETVLGLGVGALVFAFLYVCESVDRPARRRPEPPTTIAQPSAHPVTSGQTRGAG